MAMVLESDLYAGDSLEQRALWNSYVANAQSCTKAAMSEAATAFAYHEDRTKFPGLPPKINAAIGAVSLTAFALEFRLKRVLLVLAQRDKARKVGKPDEKLSKGRRKCIAYLELASLIKCDEFWWKCGQFEVYQGGRPCSIDADGKNYWNSVYCDLMFAKNIRNSFAHGDPAGIDKALALGALTGERSQDELCEKSKRAFNAFVDLIAMTNLYSGYPIKSSKLADALDEYAHLRV